MDEIEKQIKMHGIEFVRIECEDMNGISRGMILNTDVFVNDSENGVAMFEPMYSISTNGEFINGTGVMEEVDFRNGFMYPDLKTFRKLPWTQNEASVLVDFRLKSGNPQSIGSSFSGRLACKKQVEKLKELNMKFYGAFEYEFYLLNPETKQPLFPDNNFGSIQTAIKEKSLIFDIMNNLKSFQIPTETFHAEYGPAQHEITLRPSFGISCADNAFRFKQMVKEISCERKRLSTFMSKPFLNVSGSSGHFNHSLWSMDGNENLFYSPDRPHGLSEMAESWIAGLRLHANALMALANSTPNCYERIRPGTFSPVNNAWGIDNRSCAFRIKNYDKSQTYVENRIGGAAGNPYIIMAGNIIAGMDGITKKLKLDSPPCKGDAANVINQCDDIIPLPITLDEALDCLTNDELFVQELGVEFIKCFTTLKKCEIRRRKKVDENEDIGAWYRDYYAQFI